MGGAGSSRRGATYERELVNHFRDSGYGALRLPSSGSSTKRDLPDVLAGTPWPDQYVGATELIAIELKSGSATTLYVDEEEVEALKSFASTWCAKPFLASRRTTQATDTKHYLVRPEDARRTDGGRYGLPNADIKDRAALMVDSDGVEWA